MRKQSDLKMRIQWKIAKVISARESERIETSSKFYQELMSNVAVTGLRKTKPSSHMNWDSVNSKSTNGVGTNSKNVEESWKSKMLL